MQIVRQLQGFEIPASAWEESVLNRRIAEYSAENLDDLCLSGEVAWARLSPHPALLDSERSVDQPDVVGRAGRRHHPPSGRGHEDAGRVHQML